MKFAIVALLVLCAIAKSAQESAVEIAEASPLRSKVLGSVQENVNELIKKVAGDLELIAENIKDIVDNVRGSLLSLRQQTKDKLHSLKNNAVEKVSVLIEKGGEFKECAEKLVPDYVKVEKESHANFLTCSSDVAAEYKKFSKQVGQDIDGIKAEIQKFNEDVKECFSSNIISFIKCAQTKTGEFVSIAQAIKASTEDALAVARDSAAQIISKMNACNSTLLKKTSSQISVLNKQLEQCYKH